MRAPKLGPSNSRHTPIRRHNHQRRQIALQSPIQERETLNVQHVNLINEQHARNDLGFAFFAPFGHFGVDLGTEFGFDFACVACEEGKETLGS